MYLFYIAIFVNRNLLIYIICFEVPDLFYFIFVSDFSYYNFKNN